MYLKLSRVLNCDFEDVFGIVRECVFFFVVRVSVCVCVFFVHACHCVLQCVKKVPLNLVWMQMYSE